MSRIFDESFKKMAVELSYVKESVVSAAKALEIDADLLSKWRKDPRFNGGSLVSKKPTLTDTEQENRNLRKQLKDMEVENAILKKTVAIFSKKY